MKFRYRIEGMKCDACRFKIEAALAPHTSDLKVTLDPPELTFHSKSPLPLATLKSHLPPGYDLFDLPVETLAATSPSQKSVLHTYYPIFLMATYITVITGVIHIDGQGFNFIGWMKSFMAGFFFVFSAFKFLDLPGFAATYSTYDVIAQRWRGYGFLYPFLELALGFMYLLDIHLRLASILTIFLMLFSSFGVLKILVSKQEVKCACLGTVLNIPVSNVTLIENLLMVVMAVSMLVVL